MIRNFDELATTKKREDALEIIESGIRSVLPTNVMKKNFMYFDKKLVIQNNSFDVLGRIFIIGAGKPAGLMAQEIESLLGVENIEAGIVNCTTADYGTSAIKINVASHPVPDKRGIAGVKMMLALKDEFHIGKDDIVISLLGGGGSSLLPSPLEGVTLMDMQKITKLLLMSGAKINEINCVRKHMSNVLGGKLGKHFYPAKVISLIISDVIGNELDVIASGPTVADTSTFTDAHEILEKYNLLDKAPESIVRIIEAGKKGEIEETPKSLENCFNFVIGDNKVAVEGMKSKALRLGYKPIVLTYEQRGDPGDAARHRAEEIKRGDYSEYDCVLLGGETTPKVPENHGSGGRNQHFALTTLSELKGYDRDWVCASVGTDGSDFLTDYAGAIVDKAMDVKDIDDFIRRYDSYNFLQKYKSLIITGNTGTNVCDVIVYLL